MPKHMVSWNSTLSSGDEGHRYCTQGIFSTGGSDDVNPADSDHGKAGPMTQLRQTVRGKSSPT